VVINSEDVQMISEPEEHEEVDEQPLIERELESGSPAKIFSQASAQKATPKSKPQTAKKSSAIKA
jgi:hypothetical protein